MPGLTGHPLELLHPRRQRIHLALEIQQRLHQHPLILIRHTHARSRGSDLGEEAVLLVGDVRGELAGAQLHTVVLRAGRPGFQGRNRLRHILQLADVAGPAVALQKRYGLDAEAYLAQSEALGEVGGELAEEEVDVLLTLAQRRHHYPGGVEPVVEILAEAALLHGVVEVDVRGRDYADIRLLHLRGPDLYELAALQHAEQHSLGLLGQFAYLVEEEGAAVGLLEVALPLAYGAGEGPLLVAEELGVDGPLGDGSAVHGQILPVLAPAELVYDLGDGLLAHSALAAYQHGKVRGGHRDGGLQGVVKCGITPYDVILVLKFL